MYINVFSIYNSISLLPYFSLNFNFLRDAESLFPYSCSTLVLEKKIVSRPLLHLFNKCEYMYNFALNSFLRLWKSPSR